MKVKLQALLGLQEENVFLVFDHKGRKARLKGKINTIFPRGELWLELTEVQAQVCREAKMEVVK